MTKTFEFGVSNRSRLATEGYELHHAGHRQHPQPRTPGDTHKYITGKQRKVYFLSSISPAPDTAVQGQITVDLMIAEQFSNSFLMPAICIEGVPLRTIMSLSPRGFALDWAVMNCCTLEDRHFDHCPTRIQLRPLTYMGICEINPYLSFYYGHNSNSHRQNHQGAAMTTISGGVRQAEHARRLNFRIDFSRRLRDILEREPPSILRSQNYAGGN